MKRLGAIVGLSLLVAATRPASAGDHREAPDVRQDPAADIADFYAWHTEAGLVVALTFQGYSLRGDPVMYDPDVLYGVHIDTDGDNTADHDIWVRFGLNGRGEAGVRVENVPGQPEPIVGPTEQVLSVGGTSVFAGLRDDPFFWDAEGLSMTLSTAALSFNSERDFARFLNTAAIVIEFPAERLESTSFSTWATTRRRGQ